MAEKVRKSPNLLQQLRPIPYTPETSVEINTSGNHHRIAQIEELQLEKVIGTSSKGTNSLQVNPINGDVCYLAGSRLVIYSPRDAKQIAFLKSRTQRPFQCVRFSSDGNYLVAGESAFRLPQIIIWELKYEDLGPDMNIDATSLKINRSRTSISSSRESQAKTIIPPYRKVIAYEEVNHLQGHKYGIEAVLFSPRNDFLISLGDPNDRGLFVWDWRNEKKISQNLLSKPALHVEISSKQDFFVTCGHQHLKYWHLNEETGLPDTRRPNQKSPPIIQAQSVDLQKVKLQIFVGIAIQWPRVFVLASDGHIYVFDRKGKLLKWMNIKVPRAFSCSAQEGRLFCACSDGVIRIFATESLQHLLSLSKPPPLGSTNLMAGNSRIKIQQNKTNKFADVVACVVDNVNKRAVALYSDRMMFVWDVSELKSVTVQRSIYSHSGPIHDIQVVDNKHSLGLNNKPLSRLRCEKEENLTKFVTCSSDRTIRFWNFVDPSLPKLKYQEIYQCLAKNAYSKDMSSMIFIVSAIRESNDQSSEDDQKNPKTPYDHFKANPLDRAEDGQVIDVKDQDWIDLNDMVDSIRCIRVSPDGTELASGDEVGNIRIHSLEESTEFAQKRFFESHDSEVISLAYSTELPSETKEDQKDGQAQSGSGQQNQQQKKGRYMLASGGRDKQVLLYDSENNYEVFMNMDHHSSTITSLVFNESHDSQNIGKSSSGKAIELISSSADKRLISKKLNFNQFQAYSDDLETAAIDIDDPLFKEGQSLLCKDKVMSLDVAQSAQYMVSGHDKSLNLWKLPTFERVWEKRVANMEKDLVAASSSKNQAGVSQVQLRVLIDRYASLVVSSSTSKRVTIYEAASGKPLCRAQPGQITTAMCFSNNMHHLITTSDNGIIFIWRLPEELAQNLQKIKNESQKLEAALIRSPSIIEEEEDDQEDDERGESTIEKEKTFVEDADSVIELKKEEEEAEEVKVEVSNDINFDKLIEQRLEADQSQIESRNCSMVKKKSEKEIEEVCELDTDATNLEEIKEKESPQKVIEKAPSDKELHPREVEEVDQNKPADSEEKEDDEAVEIPSKGRKKPVNLNSEEPKTKEEKNIPSVQVHEETKELTSHSRQNSQGFVEVWEQILEDVNDEEEHTDKSDDVTIGEQEPNEADPETDFAILRKIDAMNYQKRFTNYNDEDSNLRLRCSSEVLGRQSITSKMKMRRSGAFVAGLEETVNKEINNPAFPLPVQSPRSGAVVFDREKLDQQLQQHSQKVDAWPPAPGLVSDIVDDKRDIVQTQKVPSNTNSNQVTNVNVSAFPNDQTNQMIDNYASPYGPHQITKANNNSEISPFQQANILKRTTSGPASSFVSNSATLRQNESKNFQVQWERSGLNVSANNPSLQQNNSAALVRRNQKQNMFAHKEIGLKGEEFKTAPQGMSPPKSARSNAMFSKNNGSGQTHGFINRQMSEPDLDRERSPFKRLTDKIFGRSPQKKRVGNVEIVEKANTKSGKNKKMPNVGKYQIDNNYIASPTTRPNLNPDSFTKSQNQQNFQQQKFVPSQQDTFTKVNRNQNETNSIQQQHTQQLFKQQNKFSPIFKGQNYQTKLQQEQALIQTGISENVQVIESNTASMLKNEPPDTFAPPLITEKEFVEATRDQNPSTYISEEKHFNTLLQAEIDTINKSLARIIQLTSTQKLKTERTKQQSVIESQQLTKRNLPESNESLAVSLQSSDVPMMRIHDKVSAQLMKTMKQWNLMIKDLNDSTDFDINRLSASLSYDNVANNSMTIQITSKDFSKQGTGFTGQKQQLDGHQAQSELSNQNMQKDMLNQQQAYKIGEHSQKSANLSTTRDTLKEDARDLLEKYSQLLYESFQQKVASHNQSVLQQQQPSLPLLACRQSPEQLMDGNESL